MKPASPFLTLDSNVVIAAAVSTEPASAKCKDILAVAADEFILVEPSIIYQEVCGTMARKISLDMAGKVRKQLDKIIEPSFLVNSNRENCVSAFSLCGKFNIYSMDALYLHAALISDAILVSLDKKDFTEKIAKRNLPIEIYSANDFPY